MMWAKLWRGLKSQKFRGWAYRVLVAVAALAVGLGVTDQGTAALYLAVAAAALGNGLAAGNTRVRKLEKRR